MEGISSSEEAESQKFQARQRIEQFDSLKSKSPNGQILPQTEEVRNKTVWYLKPKGYIKETDGLITATHAGPSTKIKAMKTHIEKQDVSFICGICAAKVEPVGHHMTVY